MGEGRPQTPEHEIIETLYRSYDPLSPRPREQWLEDDPPADEMMGDSQTLSLTCTW